MKVLLDTNIILDALQARQPFDVPAKEILRSAQEGKITCMFTANAAADIFYLYRRARDAQSAKIVLEFLLRQYVVVAVMHDDCINAVSLPMEDFEDALVVVCALKANADYIVTRDKKFLRAASAVKVITPIELAGMLIR